MSKLLDNRHWTDEHFTQRMTSEEWRKVLLDGDDTVIFGVTIRELYAKHLGAGVYEVGKKPPLAKQKSGE